MRGQINLSKSKKTARGKGTIAIICTPSYFRLILKAPPWYWSFKSGKIGSNALIDLLKKNDPGLIAINISFKSIDPESLLTAQELDAIGKAIAKSTNLRKLRLVASWKPTILYLRLLEQVNKNQSLQSLEMCYFEGQRTVDIQVLETFLRENKELELIHFIPCNNLHSNIRNLVTPLATRVTPLEEIRV